MISQLVDLVLHLDVHLAALAFQMGPWTYLILFAIIFAETGLVVTPILPGDSLLFATGALCALDGSGLNILLMWCLLVSAAVIGDNTNYQIGKWIGKKIFDQPKSLFFNPASLHRAHEFYERHGGKTVFFARFMPILRTFAPFVAGIGQMNRMHFVLYSLTGSLAWMSLFLGAGYYFGNIPWVKANFSALIMAVIAVSMLPVFISWLSRRVKLQVGAKGP
jgi:membrane-associated protein